MGRVGINSFMTKNFYQKFDWQTMLSANPPGDYDIKKYHEILCHKNDYPDFLNKYIALPLMQRLGGIGLLCGTDWTKLYRNRFFYSRLDHSVGVALIIWHFTHDKAQTLSGLFHDISTSVFSHVSDFRKGDALTQTVTEEPTARMIRSDTALQTLLKADGIKSGQVENYHLYPIADNEIPQLSADRLEYMFPSGMALDGSWTLEEIERCYNDILILKNEDGQDELGFKTLEIAEEYCRHFCMIGHILQLNENKLTLHLLGVIMNGAVELGILTEDDFMALSERQVIEKIEKVIGDEDFSDKSKNPDKKNEDIILRNKNVSRFKRLYQTFRNMTSIEHTTAPLNDDDYFCLNLQVKQRYINPLVKIVPEKNSENPPASRLYDISQKAKIYIDDFKSFQDTPYGCVRLL